MDVRCEKCQTEYELDEARLKPGGVTVKCTNCGHMFKIRKRANSGAATPVTPAPAVASAPASASGATRPGGPRADSLLDEAPTERADDGPTAVERQWLIRLENGEQKACRELATLQQWIVAGVASRESLISRTGKTWKRLGDIAELAQYFDIADEARTTRDERRAAPTPAPAHKQAAAKAAAASTVLGFGAGPSATGGRIVPDEEDETRATGNFPTPRPTTQPPPAPRTSTRTPPAGSSSGATRRPVTQPPPAPAARTPTGRTPVAAPPPSDAAASHPAARSGPSHPIANAATAPATSGPSSGPLRDVDEWAEKSAAPSLKGPAPDGNRATAAWATDGADGVRQGLAGGPVTGPFVGKLSAIPDEPAFAGKVRVSATDESSFQTGRVRMLDDDDDELLQRRRGGSHGILILVLVLLVASAAGAAVYFFVIRKSEPAEDHRVAAADAVVTPDAAVATADDAAAEQPPSAVEAARGVLGFDLEDKLQETIGQLAGTDPASLAMRALVGTQLAQAMTDRAGLAADRAGADQLRKSAKDLVLEAATAAQKAHAATPEDPVANIALAAVLRLQGKPTKDVQRYIDAARGKPGPWIREIALAEALLHKRDGKLDNARTLFAAIDDGDNKMEISNDVRARFQLALIALAQNHAADAKPLVEQILAAQKDHAAAQALAAKLDLTVAKTDPLPPEDPPKTGNGKKPDDAPPSGGDYDSLVRDADKARAGGNCGKASDYYYKALAKKPNGVEGLTGLGYCALLARSYPTAQSRFRTALAVSSRYGPALLGLAEAYTQDGGHRDEAISTWRRVLDSNPGNARAKEALKALGADGSSESPPAGSNTPPPPPGPGSSEPPPPPPAPAPTPAPGSASD